MPQPDTPLDAALIVFAKYPEPGQVKTRLTTLLTAKEAAQLYTAFVKDALSSYAQLEASIFVFVAPHPCPPEVDLFQAGHDIFEQQGHDLGERMQHAFAKTFAMGAQRVVIIGTDHPTLPLAYVQRAFEELQHPATVTIGPSEDGGYYLLGMNNFYPALFENMTYSHDQVFEQTLSRANALEVMCAVLPLWYDVDEPAALERLVLELRDEDGLPHTRAVVERLVQTYSEDLPKL